MPQTPTSSQLTICLQKGNVALCRENATVCTSMHCVYYWHWYYISPWQCLHQSLTPHCKYHWHRHWHRTACITGTGTTLHCMHHWHRTVCIKHHSMFRSISRQCLLLQYIAASAGVTQIGILLSMAMTWHSQ